MPAWCKNELQVRGNSIDLAEFMTLVKRDDEQLLSFEMLKPTPTDLLQLEAGNTQLGYQAVYGNGYHLSDLLAYPWITEKGVVDREGLLALFQKEHPKWLEAAPSYKAAMDKYGYLNWYEWRLTEWGTKWDAVKPWISARGSDHVQISFLSAWDPPKPIIVKASERFPKLEFELKYCSEHNAIDGILRCKAGATADTILGPGQCESTYMANQMRLSPARLCLSATGRDEVAPDDDATSVQQKHEVGDLGKQLSMMFGM